MPPQQADPKDVVATRITGTGGDSYGGRRSPFSVDQGRREDDDDDGNDNNNDNEEEFVEGSGSSGGNGNGNGNPQDGVVVINDTNIQRQKKHKQGQQLHNGTPPSQPQPPGELERFESGRGMRSSQRHFIQERRKSFIVEFSEMNGPPQIALLMALLAVGFGSTMGVVPAIMSDRFARLNHGYDGVAGCDSFEIGDDNKPHECFLGSSDAQAAASVSNLISNSLTFVTASVMGSLSDEYGRKGPLLIGLGLAMTPLLCLFLVQYIPTMNPWWYYSFNASTGLISWMAIALSALNDVLPPEFRAPGIGLLFAGFLFGVSFAPTLSIIITNRSVLCLVSFSVVFVGFLLTIFFVPETIKPRIANETKQRRLAREKAVKENEIDIRIQLQNEQEYGSGDGDGGTRTTTNGFFFFSISSSVWLWIRRFYYGSSCLCQTIKWILRTIFVRPVQEMSILNRNSFFRILSSLAFFTGMVQSGDQVLLLYYLEDQLSFNQKDVSVMFLIIGISGIIVQVFVMKPLNDRVGEKLVIAISFCCGSTVNFLYGLADNKATIFASLMLSCFTNMSFPTISAIKANNVNDCEQGRIQGALYSVKALASGVGPAFLQSVYSKTKDITNSKLFGPGTMWYVASFLYLIAVGLALTLPNDKANTSSRHGGGGTTSGDGNDGTTTTTSTTTTASNETGGGGGGMVINEDYLEEYRQLVSDEEDGSSSSSEEGSLSSSGGSAYGTII